MTSFVKPSRGVSIFIAALAMIALGACGGDAETPAADETPVTQETPEPVDTVGAEQELDSALRSVATAQEVYFVENLAYTDSLPDLLEVTPGGFEPPPTVTIVVAAADKEAFCIEGQHDSLPDAVRSYNSADLKISEGPC